MAEHGKCGRAKPRYGIAIHPIHESKTESKTVPHELIRLNNNGQEYHDFPLHRPTEVLSKPAKKGVLGSSSPPFGIHNGIALNIFGPRNEIKHL
jgi:hypothetical protein